MSTAGALAGIKVIDLSRLLPGPYCSMILADHGARVIAVEDRRFVSDGLFLSTVNRNKQHITLDLKTDAGKKIFFQLVEDADVVLEGFRPGVVKRLGVDYESVRKINPRIIYCSITGYGQTGAFRNRVGHDANYLSFSGVLDIIGEPDRPPSIPGVQVADIAGGGMNAALGVLMALVARGETGKGQCIDISMTDGMVAMLPVALFFRQLTGQDLQRGNAMLSHRYACYNTYETRDQRYISIGAVENRFWKTLCELLGVPDYAALQYDEKQREEILSFVRSKFKEKTLEQWEKELDNLEICWGKVQTLSEVIEDPLFREREMIVDTADGQTAIGIPVKLSETPGSIRTPPVQFGESTTAVMKELGYTELEIASLIEKGII